MKSSILALLLGATSATTLNQLSTSNFADGVDVEQEMAKNNMGFEIMNHGDKYKFIDHEQEQVNAAQAAAAKDSGVRAKWVELPACVGNGTAGEVPLEQGLANAAKATCKTEKGTVMNAAQKSDAHGGQVYDPVIHESETIDHDWEHQVTQQQQGKLNPTTGADGPKAGFNYGGVAKFGDKQDQWAPLAVPALSQSDSDKLAAPALSQSTSWEPPMKTALSLDRAELIERHWVELPNCKGDNGEVKLAENLENASIANCKNPEPPSLVETEKVDKWVELPYCNTTGTATAGELPLAADKSNASKATCKSGAPASPLQDPPQSL